MSPMSQAAQNLNWLITNFVDNTPGVSHTVVVSADGLLLAMSEGFPRDRADQLAAVASGLTSLTAGASRIFEGGAVNQTVVEMERGFLFIMSISDGSSLAVLAHPDADIGLVGYEMALLVDRAGSVLTPDLRAELQEVFLTSRQTVRFSPPRHKVRWRGPTGIGDRQSEEETWQHPQAGTHTTVTRGFRVSTVTTVSASLPHLAGRAPVSTSHTRSRSTNSSRALTARRGPSGPRSSRGRGGRSNRSSPSGTTRPSSHAFSRCSSGRLPSPPSPPRTTRWSVRTP